MTAIRTASPYERLRAVIHTGADAAARVIAEEIAALIRRGADEGRTVVLGLATGSTPVPVYRELIRMHREERLSFAGVVTFNLDEYYPLPRDHRESYWRFMQEQLFAHIDIRPENIHLPSGEIGRDAVHSHCQAYEDAIADAGGIDLQILGIGRTGHIGFNEPGSNASSRTRLVTLDTLTRRDAARDFLGEQQVPRYAITMGVGTILRARRVLLLAWGRHKAEVIARALEEPPSDRLPASFLQEHQDTVFHLDQAAASKLTRVTQPWRVGFVDWTPQLVRRAVISLSSELRKPVLKLVDKDYNEGALADLLTVKGSAYQLNIHIFNVLQHTITGWPGGKPNADDSHRPERAEPAVKRVAILAPEPQEDVLAMGGTIRRLYEQGHDVHILCLTSGELAVPDREACAALELTRRIGATAGAATGDAAALQELLAEAGGKQIWDDDSTALRRIKACIREGEARQAIRTLGVPSDRLRFLNLPFYRKGRYRRFLGDADDVETLRACLDELQPHQVFATGNQADPASVAGTAFRIFASAWEAGAGTVSWRDGCYVWLYRGSGEEWDLDQIDMAVPLSPDELESKLAAAWQHRSQHSQTPLALAAQSEVWQRVENLNRATARAYDQLGMAEYAALECFVRWQ
jgi:glucosamine-6-phosphate deaminase